MANNDPLSSAPSAAAQRGFQHWTIIGIGTLVLIIVFLLSR